MKIVVLFLFFVFNAKGVAQCEIKNRVQADGSMIYYFEPADFLHYKIKIVEN